MLLSIDTFSELFEICFFSENQLLTRQIYYKKQQFSDFIPYKLKQVKDELGLKYSDLTGVVVNVGPGSYTGVRIGVSIAKTIAYSLNIPIYAFISLDAIAYKYRFYEGGIYVIVNAGKNEAYVREYISNRFNIKPVSKLNLIKQSDIDLSLLEGKLVVLKNIKLDLKNAVFLKESVAYEGGLFAVKQGLRRDLHSIEPVYLRDL